MTKKYYIIDSMDASFLAVKPTLKKARIKAKELKKEISPARPEIYSAPSSMKITDKMPLNLNGKHLDNLVKSKTVKRIKLL